MQTTNIGQLAETAAVRYLQRLGFMILSRNWRRPQCKIDIVAGKQRVLYFVEVKHRTRQHAGRGLEYITAGKLRQMQFAADLFVAHYHWHGQFQLAAVEVGGADYRVTEFIDNIF